jgi:viologen exporter family transport system ATP-binding protein
MRCEIAAAFIHEPKVVFLDEPTIGLDFLIKEKIREFIRTVNKEKGITVFLTTHDLRDIEEISQRLIILDKGKIIYDGKIDEIRNTFNGYSTAHFRISNPLCRVDDLFSDVGDKVKVMSQNPYSVEIKFSKNTMSVARLIDTMSPHCNIIDVSIHEPSIETIVKNLYAEKAEVEV